MPIYEYRCKKCDHVEEVLQNRTDPAPGKCPECNARKSMAREMSLTSFQLKGGGWYADGYGSVPEGASKDKSETVSSKPEKKPKADKAAKKTPKKKKKKAAKKGSGQAA